ncbi:LysR family transcriptional regulator [Radiobacillus kanasensis]|uniref:LysR family transcriptional regulator n=1 Tax=Radiobacillus kanasensis TaxID=2844358 RepID=UPI001E397996|nr:LysR family transcriptional regulator [Radiobacillus kanasensis]UFT99740.1 LysR family transcriptional regulator [Radiobacillus kanasensis]
MELRHLNTFRTVVDEGGFKKAADYLGYAQSSITGHIKELESELGQPLFDRLGKHVTLTEAGRKFLPYAEDIIKLYSKSKDAINDLHEPSGQLIIGASESILTYWLPNVLKDFMKSYPQIELIIKSLNYDNLSEQLKKGDIDIAVLVELPDWKANELSIHKLKDEKLSLVHLPKEKKDKIPETILVTESKCSWRPNIEEYIRTEGKSSFSRIELPSIEAIKKCVLFGLGRSILPRFVMNNELENKEMEESHLNEEINSLGVYAAIHKDKWISRNLEVFLSALRS